MEKVKSRRIIFVLLLLTLFSFIPLRSLKFEFNIEKLFPRDDEDLAFFQQFQEQFQSQQDDEFILIGVKNNSGIFKQDFLVKIDSLTKFISSLDDIIKVYSLTSANLIYFQNEEINARPLLHITRPELYLSDSAYLFASKEYRDLLVSKDGRSIAIAAFNKQFLSDEQKDLILDS
ncbi:MAG TPA: hypothetical protein VF144_17805, partial [Chitinophagaceae bacterium]